MGSPIEVWKKPTPSHRPPGGPEPHKPARSAPALVSPAGERAAVPVLPGGRPYTRRRVSDYFRDCLRKLGIYRPLQMDQGVRYGTPHLHELRRAFAVHRLLAWYREGADLDAKLPLLATYMGHAHFGHTKTYLPLTEELLSEAAGRFAGRFDRLDWVEHDSGLR